jgi:hypothetical protein
MTEDARAVALRQPGAVDDPLTEIAREGARRMLASTPSSTPSPSSIGSAAPGSALRRSRRRRPR